MSAVYYDQWRLLSALQFGLVILGMVVLLVGVWVVSLKTADDSLAANEEEVTPLVPDAEDIMIDMTGYSSDEDELDDKKLEDETGLAAIKRFFAFETRGFSIGIGASSPGTSLLPLTMRAY